MSLKNKSPLKHFILPYKEVNDHPFSFYDSFGFKKGLFNNLTPARVIAAVKDFSLRFETAITALIPGSQNSNAQGP